MPTFRVINSDYIEFKQGLFVPRRSEFQRPITLSALADNSEERTPVYPQILTFEVSALQVGVAATDADYRLEFPEGVLIKDDLGGGVTYVQGEKLSLKELLDRDTEKCSNAIKDGLARDIISEPSSLLASQQEPSARRQITRWLIPIAVSCVGVLMVVLWAQLFCGHERGSCKKNQLPASSIRGA
ncbi:MAG TPA: hypothetical protein HPP83_12490 [Candidatus Hydrogenedentes bacterium]|nr:hypothetical protein [Candidatus Hydrogenedentota bacterium]